jgi:hypothetical protein
MFMIVLGLILVAFGLLFTVLVTTKSTPVAEGGGGGGDGGDASVVDLLQLTVDKATFDPATETLTFTLVSSSSVSGLTVDLSAPFSVELICDTLNSVDQTIYTFTEEDKTVRGTYVKSIDFSTITLPESATELSFSASLNSELQTATINVDISITPPIPQPEYTLEVVVNGTDADTDLVVGVRTKINGTLTDYPGTFTIEIQDRDTMSYFFEVTQADKDSTGYYTTTFSFGAETYNLKAVIGDLSSPVLTVTFTPSGPSSFLTLLVGNLASTQNFGPTNFALDNSLTEGGSGVDLDEPFEAEVFDTDTLLFSFTHADKVLGNNGRYEKSYDIATGTYSLKVYLRKGLSGEISSPPVSVTFIDA